MSIDRPLLRRISSLALVAGLAIGAGCEHESAVERAEVSQQLRAAEQQLMSSLNSEADLEKTIRTLQGIRGGTKEQQANRDLMLASAELEIASMRTAAMGTLEARMRHELGYLQVLIGNASALDHFIKHRNVSAVDLGSDSLMQNRQALGARLSDLERQVDMMQQPINEMEQLNADQEQRILDLRRAAESLRQEQYELDPIEAFTVFKRSIDSDRKANAIDLEMSNRQVMLDLESKPIQAQARQARDHMQELIDEMESSNDGLQSMVALQASQAEAARDLLQRTDSMITQAYEQLAEQDNGVMATDLQAIAGMLESAAKHARSGSRNVPRDAKNAAILLETQAQLELLLLQSHRIRSLQERKALLERMSTSSFLSNRDSFEIQGRKLQETIDQTREMAIGTGQSIEQALRGVRGGEVDAIQTAVQGIIAGMGGPAPAPTTPAPTTAAAPTAPNEPATPAQPTSGDGAATPQALVEQCNAIISSDANIAQKMQKMAELTELNSPEGTQAAQLQIGFAQAFVRLKSAMESKFGSSQSPTMNMLSMMTDMPRMDAAKIKMDSDTMASVPVTNSMSQTSNTYLIKTDSGWKIDMKKTMANMPSMEQGMQMLPVMTKALNDIAAKIESGEISNSMGVDMALGQAMGGASGAGRP